MDEPDYPRCTVTLAESEDKQQWKVANRLKLRYNIGQQGEEEVENLLVMQPVLSGFEMTAEGAPEPFAVYEEEFWQAFCEVEEE